MVQGDTWGYLIHCWGVTVGLCHILGPPPTSPGSFLAHPDSIPGSHHDTSPFVLHHLSIQGISSTLKRLGVKNPFLQGWGTQQQDSTSTAIPAVPENQGFLREEWDIPNTSPAPAEFHHTLLVHRPLKSITTINLWFQEPLPAASSLLKGQGKPGRSRAYPCKSFPCLAVKNSSPDCNNPDYH